MGEIKELQKLVAQFRDARDWLKYHTPKNLAQALASEVGELNDLFLWDRQPDISKVELEIADIFIYLLSLADVCKIDLSDAVHFKSRINETNYPEKIFYGRDDKHE